MIFFLRASAGLLLWSAGFTALYALHGLGCARGWPSMPLLGGTLFGWTLALAWGTFLLAASALLAWSLRPSDTSPFERWLTQASALVGLLATIVSGAPILFVSACL